MICATWEARFPRVEREAFHKREAIASNDLLFSSFEEKPERSAISGHPIQPSLMIHGLVQSFFLLVGGNMCFPFTWKFSQGLIVFRCRKSHAYPTKQFTFTRRGNVAMPASCARPQAGDSRLPAPGPRGESAWGAAVCAGWKGCTG